MGTVEFKAENGLVFAAEESGKDFQRVGPAESPGAIDAAEMQLSRAWAHEGDDRTLITVRDRCSGSLHMAYLYTGYSLENALKGVMRGIRSSVKSILYVPSCLLSLCRTIRTEEGISYRVLPHARFEGVPLPAGAGRAGLLAMLDLDEGSMQELGRLSDRLGSDPEDMVFLLLSEEISKFKKKLVKKLNKTC